MAKIKCYLCEKVFDEKKLIYCKDKEMKVTQTIELNDEERLTVQRFLHLTDQISDISGRSMDEVFSYLASRSELIDGNRYSFSGLIQIAQI